MNFLQQYRNLLNGLEDGEMKTNLVNAFGNVELDFNNAITARDSAKQTLNDYKTLVTSKIGTDDVTTFEMPKPNEDIEKIKSDLEAKYNSDMDTLRTDVQGWETKYNDATAKLEDFAFRKAVEDNGLLQNFNIENPYVKDLVVNHIKNNTVVEDGKIYAKDSTTGEKARDIKSGDFLSGANIVEGMIGANEWMPFVKPQANATGMGSKTTTVTSASKKWADYSTKELSAIRNENPSLYEQLKQTR